MNFRLTILIFFSSIFFVQCTDNAKKKQAKASAVVKEGTKVDRAVKQDIEPPKPEPRFNQENYKEKILAYGKTNKETIVEIETTFGKIRIQLYRDTPLHRANFIMLAKDGFYNNTLFYRASRGFVIQGGSSDLDEVAEYKDLLGKYKLESEMQAGHLHKRGAVSMARSYNFNPKKMSAPMSFFIVQGQKFNVPTLKNYAKQNNITLSEKQIEVYSTVGGTMHLDGEHTVFGEVISGMDVVDKIADVEVDGSENPLQDIFMTVKVIR